MARIRFLQKIISSVLGFFIGFLTWFIALTTFIGDVTIWVIKAAVLSLGRFAAKLNLDVRKRLPFVSKKVDAIIHTPAINNDRSFKVGIITILSLLLVAWVATKDLPSPKQLETRQVPQTT